MELDMFCPLSGKKCITDCAWFTDGQCAMSFLSNIETDLDYIQDAIVALEETISKKNFIE